MTLRSNICNEMAEAITNVLFWVTQRIVWYVVTYVSEDLLTPSSDSYFLSEDEAQEPTLFNRSVCVDIYCPYLFLAWKLNQS